MKDLLEIREEIDRIDGQMIELYEKRMECTAQVAEYKIDVYKRQPVISGVMDGYPAQEAGMKEGDVIKKLNSKKIHLYREVSIYTFFHGDQSIDVVYERDGKTHETTITPRYDKENDRYLFGFYGSGERTKGGPVKTLQYGVYEVCLLYTSRCV